VLEVTEYESARAIYGDHLDLRQSESESDYTMSMYSVSHELNPSEVI